MDVFSYGMQMELDGKKFYTEEAGQTTDKNISRILTFLADEEQKHYEILKKYRDGSSGIPTSQLLTDVKNVFQAMRDAGSEFITGKDTMIEALGKALEMEDKSVAFYRSKGEESDDPDQKDLFLLLKKHEDRHYALLSSMIEFYDRPQQWLEQAEFTHMEDF